MAPDPATTDDYGLPAHPLCPFCDGHDTELLSPFGSVLSVAAFWCNNCHTGFELVKWVGASRAPPTQPDGENASRSPDHPEGETGRRGDGGKAGIADD